jgi:hypothetical protein
MPDFRRGVPECVPAYRRIPRGAPAGTYYCEPCSELHYPGDICWYYEGDPEDDQELAERYPEWSGAMPTHGYDYDHIFIDAEGNDR